MARSRPTANFTRRRRPRERDNRRKTVAMSARFREITLAPLTPAAPNLRSFPPISSLPPSTQPLTRSPKPQPRPNHTIFCFAALELEPPAPPKQPSGSERRDRPFRRILVIPFGYTTSLAPSRTPCSKTPSCYQNLSRRASIFPRSAPGEPLSN